MTSKHIHNGYVYLLIALLLLWFLSPIVEQMEAQRHLLGLMFTLLMLLAAWATSRSRTGRWVSLLLAAASAGLFWFGTAWGKTEFTRLSRLASFVYCAFIVVVILRHIVSAKKVDTNILCGAASIYILIAVAWAVSYWTISDLDPAAFSQIDTTVSQDSQFYHFYYFSLVTLTSVGYGDITPVSHFAKMWVSMEAVCGTFYLAVLVSRLVSLFQR